MNTKPVTLRPSQWINLGYILFGILAAPLILPVGIMIYKILEVYFWQYELHEDHIIERKGVFSVTRTELYYHRIKGVRQDAPFLYRIVGISNVSIVSSDPFCLLFVFHAIPKGLEFSQALRGLVKEGRLKNKIQELDLYALGSS